MALVHATTVAIGGKAVVIRGPSGSGKSDLALRLIDGGALLVADDQTDLAVQGDRLLASPPPILAGLIEVRGLGLVRVAYRCLVPVGLVVDLVPPDRVERLPAQESAEFLGVRVPLLRLCPFEASAAAKVRLATLSATSDIMPSS